MQGAKLKKTELMLASNCKSVQQADFTVEEHAMDPERVLKYQRVMIDDRLILKSHVEYACEKAAKAINAIA